MKNAHSTQSRMSRTVGDDSGLALATVVLLSALLFLLATTILTLIAYRETQTTRYTARTQAMHVADAGINEFLFQLENQGYEWYQDPANPAKGRVLGPVTTEEGTWRVVATPPVTGSNSAGTPLILTSVGTLPDGTSRTVTAQIDYNTPAKYVFFTDQATSGWGVGAGATVYGPVHTNGNIYNSGTITGKAEAGKICYSGSSPSAPRPKTPSAAYPGGWVDNAKSINFAEFTKGVGDLKSQAIKSGTYLDVSSVPGTTTLGYQAAINGNTVVVSHVLRQNYNYPNTSVANSPFQDPVGKLYLQTLGTYAIPASGVMYFDDDIWVSGNYSANITVGSSQNIFINGNITRSTVPTNSATCGLVASKSVFTQYWADTVPSQHVIQAALLAIGAGGTVSAQNANSDTSGLPRTAPTLSWVWDTSYNPDRWVSSKWTLPGTTKSLYLEGSMACETQPSFSSTYSPRQYYGDKRLENNPPPLYPKIPGYGLKVLNWREN